MPASPALLKSAAAALAAAILPAIMALTPATPAGAAGHVRLAQANADGPAQSESGTDGMNEDEPPAGQGDVAPEDGAGRGDEPGDFGGCIFQERPLELLV